MVNRDKTNEVKCHENEKGYFKRALKGEILWCIGDGITWCKSNVTHVNTLSVGCTRGVCCTKEFLQARRHFSTRRIYYNLAGHVERCDLLSTLFTLSISAPAAAGKRIIHNRIDSKTKNTLGLGGKIFGNVRRSQRTHSRDSNSHGVVVYIHDPSEINVGVGRGGGMFWAAAAVERRSRGSRIMGSPCNCKWQARFTARL